MTCKEEKITNTPEYHEEKSTLKPYRKPELKCIGSITDKTKATVFNNGVDGINNYS